MCFQLFTRQVTMTILLIVAVVSITFIGPGLCDKVLIFQGNNQLTNESRAVLYLSPDLLSARDRAAINRDSLAFEHDLETDVSSFFPDGDALSELDLESGVNTEKDTSLISDDYEFSEDNLETGFDTENVTSFIADEEVVSEHDLETGVDTEDAPSFISSGDAISDLSVCLWLKIFYYRKTASYVFSYATSDTNQNELNFGIKYNQILISVGGKYIYGKKTTYIPDTWYHVCFVTSSKNLTGTFYVNGKVDRIRELTPRHILLNGSLVLGQETDKVAGGYQTLQSFSGAITRFNLYSRSLSTEEVSKLARCSGNVEDEDLVSWTTADWDISGPVVVQEIQEEEFCLQKKLNFVVIPKKRSHKEALALCQSLKSTVALPRSQEENSALYNAAEPFVDQCQPHNNPTVFFWLGAIKYNVKNWKDERGKPLNFSKFTTLHQRKKNCAGFKIPKYREEWYDVSCSQTSELCAACQEKEKPLILKMRGLCESSPHTRFFRMVDQYGEMPIFRGFTRYNIVYDKNGTWALLDVWTGTTLATFFTYNEEIPFGRREWRTTTNFDICQKPTNSSHQLLLSACYDGEYSCNDGTCIKLSQRCDLHVDCPDKSDETACEELWKPTDYLAALPPPGRQHGVPLLINNSVSLYGFSEINIRDMKLVVDFQMVMTWFDSRLRYKNLRNLTDLNYIESDSVWIPRVELLNADFPKIHKTDAILNVLRMSAPREDDPTRVSRDEVYDGENNSLQLSQKFNAPFGCVMNMQNFPFDRQHCNLLIRFASATREFMEWDDIVARYLGEVMVAEFVVENITIDKRVEENYSLVVISMTFRRRYGYYLISAYMPATMLMIISYSSLFCKKESCDLRVLMTLTTLLVLYSLHQQISDALPRTSYTKAIDVWYFFALTFIFSHVILHVFVSVNIKGLFLRTCTCYPSILKFKKRSGMMTTEFGLENKGNQENPVNYELTQTPDAEARGVCQDEWCYTLFLARIFYVGIFVIFCTIYWIIVLSSE